MDLGETTESVASPARRVGPSRGTSPAHARTVPGLPGSMNSLAGTHTLKAAGLAGCVGGCMAALGFWHSGLIAAVPAATGLTALAASDPTTHRGHVVSQRRLGHNLGDRVDTDARSPVGSDRGHFPEEAGVGRARVANGGHGRSVVDGVPLRHHRPRQSCRTSTQTRPSCGATLRCWERRTRYQRPEPASDPIKAADLSLSDVWITLARHRGRVPLTRGGGDQPAGVEPP